MASEGLDIKIEPSSSPESVYVNLKDEMLSIHDTELKTECLEPETSDPIEVDFFGRIIPQCSSSQSVTFEHDYPTHPQATPIETPLINKRKRSLSLNKAPKTSAERGREFRARKALLKLQCKQQQEPDAIVETATEDIRRAGPSEDNQVPGPSEIRTIEKRAKSAKTTRRRRERKKGVSDSSKKQAKTAAQRMREYRERKKLSFRRGRLFTSPCRGGATKARRESIQRLLAEPSTAAAPETRSNRNMALAVSRTLGGTTRPTGETVGIVTTPGGSFRLREEGSRPLLCADVLEKIEAMDMSEEEAEDLLTTTPWHVRRWISDSGSQECPVSTPLSPKTSAEAHIGNAANISNVTSVDADVRPSVSGMTTTSKPAARLVAHVGSDLDSEYDDEFDVADIQTNVHSGMGRDIPDNEELEEPTREAVNAVQSAMDEEMDRLLGLSVDYAWEEGFETFRGRPETFSGPTPGPIEDYDTAYDAFTDIWSKDIIELIVRETNRYAKQTIESLKASGNLKESSRLHKWVDTDADEMMLLFAVYMYMGIDPRTSQQEYWMTKTVLQMPQFRQLMSYNRYILLSKFLHFIDNSDVSQNLTSNDGVVLSPKLAKLAPVISHLNNKFSSLYNLDCKISIDESLTLFKGRLSWVQAIKSKAARIGIKSYELCESRTGYMYKFKIYTGKNSEGNSSADASLSADLGGKSTRIVLDLLEDLKHRGHCVTMDNFYNSPALSRYLKSFGFDCLGTLRTNRKNVPSDIANVPTDVAKGTIIARHCGDVSIVAWKDTRLVHMISTYHDAETYVGTRAGKALVKPVCVRDYNNAMGGVDLKDQKLSMYLLERKRGVKWYVKMFKRLLNVSIHNAFVLYVSSLRRRNMPPMTHREFRYELANSLLVEHRSSQVAIPAQEDKVMRLRRDVVHAPKYDTGRNNRKRCFVCLQSGTEKKVHTQCVTCGEYLCFENCWEKWHSSPNLKEERPRGRKRSRND